MLLQNLFLPGQKFRHVLGQQVNIWISVPYLEIFYQRVINEQNEGVWIYFVSISFRGGAYFLL